MITNTTYQFRKNKYGSELLIDLIRLESLEKYIRATPRQILTYYDITLITEGEGGFAIDEHEFPIKTNRLYFTSPGQIREWKVKEIPNGLVLIFEEEFLCNFFNDALFIQKLSFFSQNKVPPQLYLTNEQGEYLRDIMIKIEQEIAEGKDNHLLRAFLYQALAWLNTLYLSENKLEKQSINNRIIQFRQLVAKYFYTEHSVAFYAREMCLTPGHLNDLVKKELMITAKQFLTNRVIIEAKRLLLYSELPVTEIAWKLGFSETSYFVRLFRKETGATPLAFRNQNP